MLKSKSVGLLKDLKKVSGTEKTPKSTDTEEEKPRHLIVFVYCKDIYFFSKKQILTDIFSKKLR